MPHPFLLDTDILVYFFRGYSKAATYINTYSERIILSSIVVAELYAGVRDEEEQSALEGFFALFPVIPVNAVIAKAGGLFQRDFGKSHGVGLADAILAATAVTESAELKTFNTRHYPMLKGLRPPWNK